MTESEEKSRIDGERSEASLHEVSSGEAQDGGTVFLCEVLSDVVLGGTRSLLIVKISSSVNTDESEELDMSSLLETTASDGVLEARGTGKEVHYIIIITHLALITLSAIVFLFRTSKL